MNNVSRNLVRLVPFYNTLWVTLGLFKTDQESILPCIYFFTFIKVVAAPRRWSFGICSFLYNPKRISLTLVHLFVFYLIKLQLVKKNITCREP